MMANANVILIDSVGLPATFLILGAQYLILSLIGANALRLPPPGYNTAHIVVDKPRPLSATTNRTRLPSLLASTSPNSSVDHNDAPFADNDSIESLSAEAEEEHQLENVRSVHHQDETPVIYLTLLDALQSRDFWLLYVAFFANQFFGLVVISRLSNVAQDLFGLTPTVAAALVALDGLCNVTGRIGFAFASDYLGRKTIMFTLLCVQLVAISVLPQALNHQTLWLFILCMYSCTACYGGGFGMIPAFLADMYGHHNSSATHGIILTGWSLAGVGGGLTFTAIFNHLIANGSSMAHAYIVNLSWIVAFVALGVVTLLGVRANIRDRLSPGMPGQVLRLRLFGRVLRITWVATGAWRSGGEVQAYVPRTRPPVAARRQCCKGWRVHYLTHDEEDEEWEEFLAIGMLRARLMRDDTKPSADVAEKGHSIPRNMDSFIV